MTKGMKLICGLGVCIMFNAISASLAANPECDFDVGNYPVSQSEVLIKPNQEFPDVWGYLFATYNALDENIDPRPIYNAFSR